jgi:acetoin:2,6-dichlorophenolindophenol oxidoreductase subunit beta
MADPRQISYRAAVLEALFGEMRRDPDVILMGEDVGAAGGVFKQTEGLLAEFGDSRVIDTPISEAGAFGMAVGAAMSGSRPVFEVMFGDFITLVMDQLANQAAKLRYMSAGQFTAPLVLRTAVGVGAGLGPQHSQSLHAWAAHIPGLKVVMPATPADAKGLMTAAIRDDDPVVFVEDRQLYTRKGPVPDGEHVVPIGRAEVKRQGRDVTLIALSRMVSVALDAALLLDQQGISAEVVDVRSLVPLDVGTLVESVKKTSRAVVVDGGYRQYGITGEIAATVAEQAFDWLDAPVRRIGAANVPVPFAKPLEDQVLPDAPRLAAAVAELVR